MSAECNAYKSIYYRIAYFEMACKILCLFVVRPICLLQDLVYTLTNVICSIRLQFFRVNFYANGN